MNDTEAAVMLWSILGILAVAVLASLVCAPLFVRYIAGEYRTWAAERTLARAPLTSRGWRERDYHRAAAPRPAAPEPRITVRRADRRPTAPDDDTMFTIPVLRELS